MTIENTNDGKQKATDGGKKKLTKEQVDRMFRDNLALAKARKRADLEDRLDELDEESTKGT